MGNGQGYHWEVKSGDAYVYWLETLSTSLITGGENLASLMTDANRTTVVGFTNVTDNYVEYFQLTGVKVNKTTTAEDIANLFGEVNQSLSYTIETQNIGGQLFVLPNGSLPFALPLSTPDYSDYLEYIEAISGTAGGLISSIVGSSLNTTFEGLAIDSEKISGLLKIEATMQIENLNLTGILNATGFALPSGLFENITLGVGVNYNLTDGGLNSLSFLFNSTIPIGNSTAQTPVDIFFNITRVDVLKSERIQTGKETIFYIASVVGGFILLSVPIIWTIVRRSKS